MAKLKTTRGRSQDRKLVAINQRYEIALIAHNLKRTQKEIKSAIAVVGRSRLKIAAYLVKKNGLGGKGAKRIILKKWDKPLK